MNSNRFSGFSMGSNRPRGSIRQPAASLNAVPPPPTTFASRFSRPGTIGSYNRFPPPSALSGGAGQLSVNSVPVVTLNKQGYSTLSTISQPSVGNVPSRPRTEDE